MNQNDLNQVFGRVLTGRELRLLARFEAHLERLGELTPEHARAVVVQEAERVDSVLSGGRVPEGAAVRLLQAVGQYRGVMDGSIEIDPRDAEDLVTGLRAVLAGEPAPRALLNVLVALEDEGVGCDC